MHLPSILCVYLRGFPFLISLGQFRPCLQSCFGFFFMRRSSVVLLVAALACSVRGVFGEQSQLWTAVEAGDVKVLRARLAHDDVNAVRPDGTGQTPLMFAWCVQYRRVCCVEMFRWCYPVRPCFVAFSLRGLVDVVDVLLQDEHVDRSIGEKDGYTCAHGVGFQGRAALVPVLHRHGVDLSEPHRDGYTPLHRACWGRELRHSDTVQAFLDAGVPPLQTSADGMTCEEMTRNKHTRRAVRAAMNSEL